MTDRKGEKMSKMNNLAGIRFGRLTAIEPTARYKNGEVIWKCKCDCGKVYKVINGVYVEG